MAWQRDGQRNGSSDRPDLSRHGRVVSFVSEASNLVRHDTNRVSDVFIRG